MALDLYDEAYGVGFVYADVEVVLKAIRALQDLESRVMDAKQPMRKSHWHEEDGPVLWWRFPVSEAPYCGTPLDDEFPDYVTHWTRIEPPVDPPPEEIEEEERE
jgi:hypothetical protein